MYKIIVAIIKPFIKILFPYEAIGSENLSKINEGYILCSNHLSNLDAIFLAVIHPRPIFFMAKAELFEIKLFGKMLSALGVFSIQRGKNDKVGLNTAESVLKSNKVLGIFIEGTRSKTGGFLRPKSGVSVLSHSTKKPILPVCITGANNNKIKIFTKTKIKYGELIRNEDLEINPDNLLGFKKATKYIMSKITDLR
ncbi:MAG: 1-acyl-sn-glycerol-3-phosphate acyltransferase [Oscillospiraceae bacterium]|nr:1-acyl-sn-glycerol-3-phosphate acyltransferase [Oscillospiraceae bacterium]